MQQIKLDSIEEAIEEIRNGNVIVVVDDEAAQHEEEGHSRRTREAELDDPFRLVLEW